MIDWSRVLRQLIASIFDALAAAVVIFLGLDDDRSPGNF